MTREEMKEAADASWGQELPGCPVCGRTLRNHPGCYPCNPPCVPNGFGLCSTHPACDYAKTQVEEAHQEIESLKRENRRLRRMYIETAKRMEEVIEEWNRTAAWMKSTEENT